MFWFCIILSSGKGGSIFSHNGILYYQLCVRARFTWYIYYQLLRTSTIPSFLAICLKTVHRPCSFQDFTTQFSSWLSLISSGTFGSHRPFSVATTSQSSLTGLTDARHKGHDIRLIPHVLHVAWAHFQNLVGVLYNSRQIQHSLQVSIYSVFYFDEAKSK
jgi:hypothetical protein